MGKTEFFKELETLINKHSIENKSNTPDYILAKYMKDCLIAGERLIISRENYYTQ